MLNFIIGLIIGGVFGVFVMAIFVAAGRTSENEYETENKNEKD